MSRAVTSHRFTLSTLMHAHWAPTYAPHAWAKVEQAAVTLFAHDTVGWEFHSDRERIDLSIATAMTARASARLHTWTALQRKYKTVSSRALEMLTAWTVADNCYQSIWWEQDTPTGDAGLFVTVAADTSFSEVLRDAHTRFGLSDRLAARAHALCEPLGSALRPIALGSFARVGVPQELRLILRPTQKDWLSTFPRDLRQELEDLLAQIPAQSDVNIALGIGEDRISSALEARYTAEAVPNADWEPWLDIALPERNALQHEVLAHAFKEPRWFVPERLPEEVLLDAFVRPSNVVPVVQVRISHVKIQRTPDGRLLRKLYIRGDVLWLQLGMSAG